MIKKYLNTFLISFVILLIIFQYVIFAYFYYIKGYEIASINQTEEIEKPTEDSEKTVEKENFYVEVKGAVNNPGVYEVSSDNIINDVVNLSGGLKNNAYTKNINLSKTVSKEMVIYIYTNYEYSLLDKKDQDITECNCPKMDISTCIDKGASTIISDESKPEEKATNVDSDESSANKININTASKELLTSLSGIGDAKAQKIIDYRNQYGFFKSIDELKNVSGISEKLFEQIKEFITI